MKRKHFLLLIMIVLFSSFSALASNAEAKTAEIQERIEEERAEKQEALHSAIQEYIKSTTYYSREEKNGIQSHKAFSAYIHSDFLGIQLRNHQNLSFLWQEENRVWYIPIEEKEKTAGWILGQEDEQSIVSYSYFHGGETGLTMEDVLNEIENDSRINEPVRALRIIHDECYMTWFAAFRTDDMEYIMPCSNTWEAAGLFKGEIYPASYFSLLLNRFLR